MNLILTLFIGVGITTAWATEVRFYTVKDTTGEGNNSYSATIRDLVVSWRLRKMDEIMGTRLILDADKTKQSVQCSMLHKLFKKYKRELNSDQSMGDEPWQSVRSVAYLKVNDGRGGVRIPLGVKANVTGHLIGSDINKILNKLDPSQTKYQMEAMAHSKDDKIGRLIPRNLGGPAKWYNFAPLMSDVWSLMEKHEGNFEKWTETEGTLRQWMTEELGSLEMLVVLEYKDLKMRRGNKQAPNFNTRPSGFASCHRLYDSNGTIKNERFLFLKNQLN